MQKPIIECLKDYEMDGAKNELSRLIPKTILFQHFVDLRLTLRRYTICSTDKMNIQKSTVYRNACIVSIQKKKRAEII